MDLICHKFQCPCIKEVVRSTSIIFPRTKIGPLRKYGRIGHTKLRWAYKIITLFLSIVIFYRSFEPLRRMASRSPLSHWFPWFLSASTICQNMLHHFSPINKSCLFAYNWIEAVSFQLASKQWTWTVFEQAEALSRQEL